MSELEIFPNSPSCPQCGARLTYVEEAMVRRESPVTLVFQQSDESMTFLLGEYDDASSEEYVTEIFEKRVECGSINCDFHVPGELVGEFLPQ